MSFGSQLEGETRAKPAEEEIGAEPASRNRRPIMKQQRMKQGWCEKDAEESRRGGKTPTSEAWSAKER